MTAVDPDWKLLGQTVEPNLTIGLDQLGAPGVHGVLQIVPLFTDEQGSEAAPRPPAIGPREFELKARLSRIPTVGDINGAFGAEDGDSYLTVAAEVHQIEVDGTFGKMRLSKNSANELSMVSANLVSTDADAASDAFTSMLTAFIDRVSYLGAVPVFIAMIVARDITTEVQSIYIVSPPRSTTLSSGGETLYIELSPVYALYREAQNSTSPYYRLLCLYKIMEGLLGPLRVELRKRAKHANVSLSTPKVFVPEHPDFPSGLRGWIGKPVKDLFDNFLQKEFRDSMAHFNLKGKHPINVSQRGHWKRFLDVAFVADLCVRVLVRYHEETLRNLPAAALPGLPASPLGR